MTSEGSGPHPTVAAAARGELPSWARCGAERAAHARRVASLMADWGEELGIGDGERGRWLAAGILHDALREASEAEVRAWTELEWPVPVLHGPACAARLRAEGVEDEGLLRAVAYHTVGHPRFDLLGDVLYLADFLEPGREFLPEEREALRGRMPAELSEVRMRVLELRLAHLLESRKRVVPETVRYWNRDLPH